MGTPHMHRAEGKPPADHVGFLWHAPSSTAPNLALPLGELSPQVTERGGVPPLSIVGLLPWQ